MRFAILFGAMLITDAILVTNGMIALTKEYGTTCMAFLAVCAAMDLFDFGTEKRK